MLTIKRWQIWVLLSARTAGWRVDRRARSVAAATKPSRNLSQARNGRRLVVLILAGRQRAPCHGTQQIVRQRIPQGDQPYLGHPTHPELLQATIAGLGVDQFRYCRTLFVDRLRGGRR